MPLDYAPMCPVTLMHTLPVWSIETHRTDEGIPFLTLLLDGSDRCLVLERAGKPGRWRFYDASTCELIWEGDEDQLPLEWRMATMEI